jgi:hypothetical protein
MTKSAKRKVQKKQEISGISQKGLKARMQMLGFVRGKDSFMELLSAMQKIERELTESYEMLRSCESGSEEEDVCMDQVRALEDKRFQLLSELHGNRVNNYHLLSGL